jgi:Domain of unknown function (DUF1707)
VAESGKDLTLRASHEDRDRVIELLRVAAGDGRLTMAELDERIELAAAARTYAELATVTADLPADPLARAVAPSVQAKDVVRIDIGSGHNMRNGPWIVPKRMEIKVRSGHITLDFTEAVITEPVLSIDVEIGSGHLMLITKPGIVVDPDDISVRNGHVMVSTPWGNDVPQTLRVEVTGRLRSGHFMAGPRHRGFWQWLTRKPHPWQLPAA